MPVASKKLDINVRISVNKRFVKDKDVVEILKGKYNWNTPRLNFVERRSDVFRMRTRRCMRLSLMRLQLSL
jgi:hypothetical protein